MNNINTIVGSVIAKHRKNCGFSQEDFADKAQIHRTYVSQLERGLKSPTISILLRIARALDLSLTALIEEIEKNYDLSNS